MRDEKITGIWKRFEQWQSYQKGIGLTNEINQSVKFYEGDQWPAPTKETELLPRPVHNICAFIADNKKSQILNAPAKIVYTSHSNDEDAQTFTNFVNYKLKQMRHNHIIDRALDDGKLKGTAIIHFYWDAEAGYGGKYKGDVRCETIDVANFGVANPNETDIQKQEWIQIASRLPLKTVQAMLEDKTKIGEITPDDYSYVYEKTREQDGSELVTVITEYFRQGGEVYFKKATRSVELTQEPIPLNPELVLKLESTKKYKEEEQDAADSETPDAVELGDNEYKFSLYPIAIMRWKTREGSIYGRSEIEGLIPVQKSINFMSALLQLNTQQMAAGKYIVKDGALRGQEITNGPQVITDYYQGAGDGIKKLAEQPINTTPLALVDKMLEITRVLSGATEVMTGEVIGANMSGAAIAQLQNQAAIPLRAQRERFLRFIEAQGRILEQFVRLYYDIEPFVYDVIDAEGTHSAEGIFDASRYKGVELDLAIEAGTGVQWTEGLQMQVMEALLNRGLITPQTYIKGLPKNWLVNRDEILQALDAQEQSVQEQLKQALALIQKQQEAMDSVQKIVNENRQLKEQLAVIAAAYLEAVAQNQASKKALEETVSDAQTMAQMLPTE